MPWLIISTRVDTSKIEDTTYYVDDIVDATKALRQDLFNTADPVWAGHIMKMWELRPGYCEMPDQSVVWIFEYKENL